MKTYIQPAISILYTDSADLLTSSGELTLKGFTVGEADGIGDVCDWKG